MGQSQHIGIPKARDARGQIFDRAAIDEAPAPFVKPLQCGACSVPVFPVRGSTRRDGTSVVPYPRLQARAEHDHDPDCAYHFDARVGDITTEHRAEIDREGDTYLLTLRDPSSVAAPSGQAGAEEDGRVTRLDVHPSNSPSLQRTIQAAASIARLLRHFGEDPAAQARFQATYGGRRIAWSEFFFDTELDTEKLAQRLTSPSQYPIAVAGVIDHAGPFRDGTGRALILKTRRGAKSPDGRWVNAVLRASQPEHLGYQNGHSVIGYGVWKLFPVSPVGSPRVEAQLWCDFGSATTTLKA